MLESSPPPEVVSISACCSGAVKLAPFADAALIDTGYAVGSYSGLTATAQLSDGSTVAATGAVFEVISDTCGAAFASAGGSATIASVSRAGVIHVRATMGRAVSGPVTLQCVNITGLTATLSVLGEDESPPQRRWQQSQNVLHRINCSPTIFQSARTSVAILVSDGSPALDITFSPRLSIFSTNTSVLRKSFGNTGFTGVSPGSSHIIVRLHEGSSNAQQTNLSVQVSNNTVLVTSVVASPLNPSDTLRGRQGSEFPIIVRMDTSDGASISNIFSGGWPDYPPASLISGLFSISSDSPNQVCVCRRPRLFSPQNSS